MKALSVKQPWAGLIASGRKTVELRSWSTSHRGPLLICASLRYDARGAHWGLADEPRGVAVCVVNLVDVRPAVAGDADTACFPVLDGFAWVLRDARRAHPFHVRGRLSLFDVEPPRCGEG